MTNSLRKVGWKLVAFNQLQFKLKIIFNKVNKLLIDVMKMLHYQRTSVRLCRQIFIVILTNLKKLKQIINQLNKNTSIKLLTKKIKMMLIFKNWKA